MRVTVAQGGDFLGICEESRPKKFANCIRIGAPKRLTPTQEIRAKVQICFGVFTTYMGGLMCFQMLVNIVEKHL